MSEVRTKVEVDCSTGIQTEVPLTPEELIEYEKLAVHAAKQKADEDARIEKIAALKKSAKDKLVAGQPLTEEEAAVITF